MLKKSLSAHKYSQCCVVLHGENNSVIDFISYRTHVIRILNENGRRFITCSGTYSATTRKQIGWFLREYAPDLCYYDMKKIAGDLEYHEF